MIKTDKEHQRLQALKSANLLDSPAEAQFDRITRLAQQLLDIPIALISLVDADRQWFKSKQGLDVCETPKKDAFCKFTIESTEPFIVQDASQHADFKDNPLVTGAPHIRFYAGVPIHSPDGYALGTLCVIDTVSRELSDEQLALLVDLAKSVESLIAADAIQFQLEELTRLRADASYQASLNQVKADLALETQSGSKSLEEQFERIVRACCDVLQADVASIWLQSESGQVRCAGQFELCSKQLSSGAILRKEEHQAYWNHLIAHGELIASDVETHPALNSLFDDYLKPNRVLSLLDLLITDESGFQGCLCIESRGQSREWSSLEVSFIRDISSLISRLLAMQRQQAMSAKSAEYAATLTAVMNAAIDVAIIATDAQGVIRIFNHGAQDMLGYKEAEVLQHMTPLLFHKADELESAARELELPVANPCSFSFFQHAANSAELSHRHWTYVRKDGAEIKVLLKLSKIYDHAGLVTGYLGIALDVTEELKAQRETALQQSRLKALFDLSPVGIALNDFETGQFLDGNLKLLEPTGYTEEEFNQLSYFDLTPPEYHQEEGKMLESMIAHGRYGPFEKEYIRKDGTRYPILLNGVVVEDADGKKLIWSIIEDISERKQLDQMKSQFIATVSHELRTPLTSVAGALSLLLSGRLGDIPAKARSMLTIANNNSKRLVNLINDLLDFEKLASGNMRFELQTHALLPLIHNTINDNSTYASQKRIQIQLKECNFKNQALCVQVDESRFHQIMNNLLSNALKFSPADSVIEVTVVEQPDFVRVMVTDHGLGIPEEFKDKIFTRFQQARASDARETNGTGLGLAITKELVEAMGGQVDFVSTQGEGSCFYFDLPIITEPKSAVPAVSSDRVTAEQLRHALVVEDDPEACEVLAEIYISHGFHVATATSIKKARVAIHKQPYELISLDLNLPDGKGLDFLHEVRASKLNADSKVIIISGQQVDSGTPENYRSARLDWLLKPVSENTITRAIRRMVDVHETFKVLHVEDDTDLSQVVNSMLGTQFTITHAANFKEASTFIESQVFDAVLLDVGLPDGCGTELIPMIKNSNPDAAIVILSGQDLCPTTSLQIHNALLKTDLPSIDLQETLYKALKQQERD